MFKLKVKRDVPRAAHRLGATRDSLNDNVSNSAFLDPPVEPVGLVV